MSSTGTAPEGDPAANGPATSPPPMGDEGDAARSSETSDDETLQLQLMVRAILAADALHAELAGLCQLWDRDAKTLLLQQRPELASAVRRLPPVPPRRPPPPPNRSLP
jgi:hypothetical protein